MQVVLYKKTRQNRLYYYSIDDRQQSLFHPYALTLRWGTSLEGGRERQLYFSSEHEKDLKVRQLLKTKLKEYQVLYSYFKNARQDGEATAKPSILENHG